MTKIMTTKEIQNLNIDNTDIKIVKDFAYLNSVINPTRSCSREIKRRLRLRRMAMEELGKTTKSKDAWMQQG